MINDIQRKQVRDILLTPLSIPSRSSAILASNQALQSGQTYYSGLDPDMSNLAVGFYERLYADILNDPSILNDKGYFCDKNYAGDTMNSYRTIRNILTKASGHEAETAKNAPLKRLQEQYHCLANFWLIPMFIGRGWANNPHKEHSKTANACADFMDRYLSYLNHNWEIVICDSAVGEYFSKFSSYSNFKERHFIPGETLNSTRLIEKPTVKDVEKTILEMLAFIETRASLIVKSSQAEQLWHYFNAIGLIKTTKATKQ